MSISRLNDSPSLSLSNNYNNNLELQPSPLPDYANQR